MRPLEREIGAGHAERVRAADPPRQRLIALAGAQAAVAANVLVDPLIAEAFGCLCEENYSAGMQQAVAATAEWLDGQASELQWSASSMYPSRSTNFGQNSYTPENLASWVERHPHRPEAVEDVINHVHLEDLTADHTDLEAVKRTAQQVREAWILELRRQVPDRPYEVSLNGTILSTFRRS